MPVAIPVERLRLICDPVKNPPWGIRLKASDILMAVREGRLIAEPGTQDHAGRIAYFVQNPPWDPIEIDVGAPSLGLFVSWPVLDGNHRLAAAILSGRKTILASVSGSLDYAKELFGVDCEELAKDEECTNLQQS